MHLFLRQNTVALPQNGSTVLFHVFDASGQLCGIAEQLSGLLSDGFQITGQLPELELAVRAVSARLPGGMMYLIRTGIRPRARLTVLRDRLHMEADGLPCTLLGTPVTGEYTLTDPNGQVLMEQRRCPGPDGRNVFVLTIADESRADVYLGIAVCLSRLLAHPSGKFSPVPAGL